MKIVHVINSLEIGGAQRLLADILPILNKENKVELVVLKNVDSPFRKNIVDAGVKIHNIACKSYYNPINAWKLRKYIKNADVVHAHLFPVIWWGAVASLFCKNCNLVYTEHSTHNKRRDKSYLRSIERFAYSRYKKIISISQQTQDNLIAWLKVKSLDSRFVVIENGVAIEKFARQQQGVDKNSLIMVSRFAEMKDQETVIRAMANVKKEAHLYLVGDGPNRQHCEEVAYEIGVNERVHFLGSRSDIPELISQSYIGIQSSLWEGFGLTAVELMAAGKPVIATNVNGLKQVVEGAGRLFEVGDSKALASFVNELLCDKNLYEKMAQQSVERAKLYDIKRMADTYQTVYNGLYE